MSQTRTSVLAARVEQTIVLKFAGRVTAEFCPAVRSWCEDESDILPSSVAVCLQDVEHFDSTFLGTLLCLRSRFGEDHVVLISPGPECEAGLRRMGAHLLFPIRQDPLPEDIEWINLSDRVSARDAVDFQYNLVEAHLELARTPGPLQKVYEPIARQAEREFVQRHGREKLSNSRLPRQRVPSGD